MKTLIIDNFDSFTFNLYQHIAELKGNPTVLKNTASMKEVLAAQPTHIIISPGPGNPGNSTDFGISHAVIASLHAHIPMLGVCLGHQGIAQHFGARIIHSPEAYHGKTSQIIQTVPSKLFHDIPHIFTAMRYHSLIIDETSLPSELHVTARTQDDNLIMAIEHETYPLFGVQFHPESIGTPQGKKLLKNFLLIQAFTSPNNHSRSGYLSRHKSTRTHTRKHAPFARRLPRKTHLAPVLNELE